VLERGAFTNEGEVGMERSAGIGFMGMLAVLFIGLKLSSIIDWSWWWVLTPLWGPMALLLLAIAILMVVAAIDIGVKAIAERMRGC